MSNTAPILNEKLEVRHSPSLLHSLMSLDRPGINLYPVSSFDIVEGFWSLYNNMPCASQMAPKTSYYVFMVRNEAFFTIPQNHSPTRMVLLIP
jgi:hypothetical protein